MEWSQLLSVGARKRADKKEEEKLRDQRPETGEGTGGESRRMGYQREKVEMC